MAFIVNTPCGPVQGTAGRVSGTVAYKGIRYATAGRWEYPQQVTSWEGTYDATEYGACSYQGRAFDDESKSAYPFYYKEFRENEKYTYSEDCLFLNIWTPEDVKEGDNLPVLVYIHGGAFTGGCGHEKHFDNPVWPKHGVIGVTLNYRLGPMGFVALPELEAEAGTTGNYGLWDQMTAIKWVKDNIASFGGNPENITIMGQSAGAMSVQQQSMSPMTEGLFQKAVLSSGGGVSMAAFGANKKEDAVAFWQEVKKAAGCETLEQFRALPVTDLFQAFGAVSKNFKGLMASPIVDGKFVVATGTEILAENKQHQIPYMIGSNSEDMMPPLLYQMSLGWAAAQKVPSYTWFFDRQLPGDTSGAFHSADLWYWFGTLDNCWRPMTEKDQELSDLMIAFLCNFCKTGNPNGEGLPAWPVSGDEAMCMGENPAAAGKPDMEKLYRTMQTSTARGEH